MILLLAIAAGLSAGIGWARWRGQPYQPPEFKYLWLVLIAFLPQFIFVFLPIGRRLFPDGSVVIFLFTSQTLLLVFVWINRRVLGMSILLFGLLLNLAVMTVNGGFMPISQQTASRLVSDDTLRDLPLGSRFGAKDILLSPNDTRLEWLADRFLPPIWFPYQVAFSLGDVFIALGVFWLLAKPESSIQFSKQIIKRGLPI